MTTFLAVVGSVAGAVLSTGSVPVVLVSPAMSTVPEPASLLLFGSGLAAIGAGLRRRYSKAKLASQGDAAKESK